MALAYAPEYRLKINGNELPAALRGSITSVNYQDGRVSDGPFQAYLVRGQRWIDPGHVPASAVPLGALEITERGEWNDRATIRFLIYMLTIAPLQNLYEFLQRTPAGPLLDPNSEKTAISVRSNVANYVSALRYLPLERTPFRLREWVAAERSDEWLFLNAADAQLASVRPLRRRDIDGRSHNVCSIAIRA